MLKLYPEAWPGRAWRVTVDLTFCAWLIVCAVAGSVVYQLVAALVVIADALTKTGMTFNHWIDAFRGAVPRGVPFLGNALIRMADQLQRNGGDALVQRGVQAHTVIERLAVALALLVALPPALSVCLAYLPWRWRDGREMASTAAFVNAAERSGHLRQAQAVLAYRALAVLPFRQLMRTSPDPAGDLAAGRYQDLAAAMARRAGVRLPESREAIVAGTP